MKRYVKGIHDATLQNNRDEFEVCEKAVRSARSNVMLFDTVFSGYMGFWKMKKHTVPIG